MLNETITDDLVRDFFKESELYKAGNIIHGRLHQVAALFEIIVSH